MKQTTTTAPARESTYMLLVRSGETERNLSETAIYLLFILSTVFSIWHVAQQPLTLPGAIIHTAPVAQSSGTPRQGV